MSAAGLDLGEIFFGHDAFFDERLAGEQFDLQPDAEFVFVRPNRPHFRAGIARNHGIEDKQIVDIVEMLNRCIGQTPRQSAHCDDCTIHNQCFAIFAPGFFKNFAFTRRQAMDAVRGNFFENRVHFVFQKFVGGNSSSGLFAAERQNAFLPARLAAYSRGAARRRGKFPAAASWP